MSKHVRIIEPKRKDSLSATNEEDVTVINVYDERRNDVEKGVIGGTEVGRWQDPYKIEERQQKQKKTYFGNGLTTAQQGKVIQRWQLPKLVSQRLLRKGNGCKEHGNGSCNKSLIEDTHTKEEQLELYRSMQKHKFVTLHEELSYLRMTYVHSQNTLHLRSEEIIRLRTELADKVKEADRLKELLIVTRKRLFGTNGLSGGNETAVTATDAAEPTPSLALFAATTSNTVAAGDNGKMVGKLLMDLRQNVALRDTAINNLRMELGSLRNAKKAVDDRVQKLETELVELRSRRGVALAMDTSNKEMFIDEPQRSSSTTQVGQPSGLNRVSCNDASGGNDDGAAATSCHTQHENDTGNQNRHNNKQAGGATSGVEQQLTGASHVGHSPPVTGGTISLHIPEELRSELQHIRQFIDHEKKNTEELERQWRQNREAELRVMGAELATAKAEVDAYKREMSVMQKKLSVATFAETQLQVAQNENNALQQRVLELRDVNAAQAMREKELQSELSTTKEAHSRCENEIASFQRRLNASKDSESRLREEIDVLLDRLARAEEKLCAKERGDLSLSPQKDGRIMSVGAHMQDDISSYTALMGLNIHLQEQLKVMETELQKARETAAIQVPQLQQEPRVIFLGNAVETASNKCTLFERTAQLSKEIVGAKLKLSAIGAFLKRLEKIFVRPNVSKDGLKVEFDSACNAYDELSCSCDKMAENVAQIKENEYPTPGPNDVRSESKEKQQISCVRSRLQNVQQHALAAAESTDVLKAPELQPQSNVSTEDFSGNARERKISSLRAARTELKELRELLALRETAMEELKKESNEQRRIIEFLRHSLLVHAGASLPPAALLDSDEDRVIEDALRNEAMLLDGEMNALRHELDTMKKERDYWRTLARNASGAAVEK